MHNTHFLVGKKQTDRDRQTETDRQTEPDRQSQTDRERQIERVRKTETDRPPSRLNFTAVMGSSRFNLVQPKQRTMSRVAPLAPYCPLWTVGKRNRNPCL